MSGGPGWSRRFDPERLAFFSDAVMAIAITLLIIDVRVPDLPAPATDAQLQAALGSLVPQFLAFLLSFAVIAVWWNSHHRLFGALAAGDGPLIVLDFVFLAAVVFLPLPTAILGRYASLTSAIVLYAATNIAIGLASVLMWWHALHGGLLVDGFDPVFFRQRLAYMTTAPAVFAVSIPIALVDANLAPYAWNAIWVVLIGWRLGRRLATRARPA